MLAALALFALTASKVEPAKTASAPWVAVFISSDDTSLTPIAGKVEVELARKLEKKGAQVIDLNDRYPQPKQKSSDGDAFIKEGKDAYDNLDMDAAIQKLTDGLLFFVRHPELTDPKRLADTFMFLGAAELQNGKKADAAKEFYRAAILDPDYKPDPRFFAADVQKAFTAAQHEIAQKPKSAVHVESIPGGAQLELDGKPLGLTPLASSVDLTPGRHHLRATRPGYVTAAQFPEVRQGQPLDVKLELTPLPAFAESVDLAHRLTNRNNFDAQVLPPQAAQLSQQMQARFFVLGTVSNVRGSNKVELQVWDVETGDRLREVKFDADEFGTDQAADTIRVWIDRPAADFVVEARPSAAAGFFKSPVLWTIVGVVAVGAAVGVGVYATQDKKGFDFITGIP